VFSQFEKGFPLASTDFNRSGFFSDQETSRAFPPSRDAQNQSMGFDKRLFTTFTRT
jgi:hypothetical protein